jgi:hypothetical protein
MSLLLEQLSEKKGTRGGIGGEYLGGGVAELFTLA